jgi:ascorbate-specific PTS system EIIC-type component UlaA
MIEGNFCQHCGQNTNVDKINLPNFLHELSDSIFQINKGILFTIRELFVRPGESIREFIKGKRKYHFKPVAFALVMSTV